MKIWATPPWNWLAFLWWFVDSKAIVLYNGRRLWLHRCHCFNHASLDTVGQWETLPSKRQWCWWCRWWRDNKNGENQTNKSTKVYFSHKIKMNGEVTACFVEWWMWCVRALWSFVLCAWLALLEHTEMKGLATWWQVVYFYNIDTIWMKHDSSFMSFCLECMAVLWIESEAGLGEMRNDLAILGTIDKFFCHAWDFL